MPLYEEKFISPLAVRFTQSHIRDIFRDSRVVEETIEKITTRPGSGDEYDLIIEVPFPNIEVLRWYMRDEESDTEPDREHWFTLDNRRLYCLQRVAASLWPKRVGAVVELLFAAPNSVKRKEDTTSAGRNVSIGHNTRTLFTTFDWRNEAGVVRCNSGHEVKDDHDSSPWACDTCSRVCPSQERFRCLACDFDLCRECHATAPRQLATMNTPGADPLEIIALKQLSVDDRKDSSNELTDADALSPKSRLLRHMTAAAAQEAKPVDFVSFDKKDLGAGSTNSTADSSGSPRSNGVTSSERSPTSGNQWPAVTGSWTGQHGEIYAVTFGGPDSDGKCLRTDPDGSVTNVALRYDPASCSFWLGAKWSFYVELADIRAHPAKMEWREAVGKNRVRLTWNKTSLQLDSASEKQVANRRQKGWGSKAKS